MSGLVFPESRVLISPEIRPSGNILWSDLFLVYDHMPNRAEPKIAPKSTGLLAGAFGV